MRYHAFLYTDGDYDTHPQQTENLGLFLTEKEAVAEAHARLAELPEDEPADDGTLSFGWRGLVERGELGRVHATEYDEHGEPLLLEAFPDLAWEDERPRGVTWWVDQAYLATQPYLAR